MATVINIPYKPRRWAKIFHGAATRWRVLILHRRAGKTTAAINHLIRDAVTKPNTRYAYIAPTYKQAKRIVWAMAKFYAKSIPEVQFNSAELLITFSNGSEIMILGSDDPDSLRGIALWGVFLDEYPLHSPIVFTEIVSKCLADNLGYCIFGGTPKGKGHFYKIYQVAANDPEWTLVLCSIDDSLKNESGAVINNLRQALIDDKKLVAQGLMTQDEFMQEWYNSFDAALRGAVYLKQLAELRATKRLKKDVYNPKYPVYTVWDLGISDAMAIGFYQRYNGKMYMVDYYENTNLGFAHYVKVVMKDKVKEKGYKYAKHFAPHDIGNRELMSGKTRLSTAEEMGLTFETNNKGASVIKRLPLEDGIDLGRALMTRIIIDAVTCELFIEIISQYVYEEDEKKQQLKKTPRHDFSSHAADVHRYAATIEDEMYPEEDIDEDTEVGWEEDSEFVGQDDDEIGLNRGFGKHPALKGVNIGELGHKKGVQ